MKQLARSAWHGIGVRPVSRNSIQISEIRVLEQLLRRARHGPCSLAVVASARREPATGSGAHRVRVRRCRSSGPDACATFRWTSSMVSPGHSRAHAVERLRRTGRRCSADSVMPNDRHDARNPPERLERLDLPPEPALDAADLVVQRLVAVEADRDDRVRGPAAGNALDARARCGRSESRWSESAESRAAASRSTTASRMSSMSGRRKISPPVRSAHVMLRVLADERDDLVGRQLVGRLALPDVARLALVLAPVGEAQFSFSGAEGRLAVA